jgi:hypothetical protein
MKEEWLKGRGKVGRRKGAWRCREERGRKVGLTKEEMRKEGKNKLCMEGRGSERWRRMKKGRREYERKKERKEKMTISALPDYTVYHNTDYNSGNNTNRHANDHTLIKTGLIEIFEKFNEAKCLFLNKRRKEDYTNTKPYLNERLA